MAEVCGTSLDCLITELSMCQLPDEMNINVERSYLCRKNNSFILSVAGEV